MSRIDPARLRLLLAEKTREAYDEALRQDGRVSTESFDGLQRLNRLLELSQVASPRKRWPIVAALVGTLAIVSALLFIRVPHTDVNLDLVVSEVRFESSKAQALSEGINAHAIGASGLVTARLPAELRAAANHPVDGQSALLLSATEPGSVTLATLIAPVGTQVNVRSNGVPGQFRLSLEHFEQEVRADLHGPVHVEWAGGPAEDVTFAGPRSVVLQSGPSALDLDITLPEGAQIEFAPQIEVRGLKVARIDEFGDPGRTLVSHVSTIESGALFYESLDGRSKELRPAEPLRFSSAVGSIRALRVHDDKIELKFQGRVSGMSTGSGADPRSLMPTMLEWLSAHHGLALLWGGTLYAFGLVVTVLRWWGIRW